MFLDGGLAVILRSTTGIVLLTEDGGLRGSVLVRTIRLLSVVVRLFLWRFARLSFHCIICLGLMAPRRLPEAQTAQQSICLSKPSID